ncbi:hypothetical protein OG216_33315 [Streptomycetaceae bacterium NBC_01309]
MRAANEGLMPYREVRAAEDALSAGGSPVGVSQVFLPVWAVEIRATVTTSEPYDLIDRYLELGIDRAGLTTVTGLADFFTLDPALVDRALRFLAAIGHVVRSGDDVQLTKLGRQSVSDGRRLRTTHEDRRILYFDAYTSSPLTRAYYDNRDVTLLSGGAVADALDTPQNRWFLPLMIERGFRREVLTSLGGKADRERYNLPEHLENPESVREALVYLPLYVVRCAEEIPTVGLRHLAYSQAAQVWDEELSQLVDALPGIAGTLGVDFREVEVAAFGTWAREIDPDATGPVQLPDGSWRLTFTPEAFATGALAYSKAGSFQFRGRHCVRIWCDDAETRRRALVERMNTRLAARTNLDREVVESLAGRIAAQLSLSGATVEALRGLAERHGYSGLATQLAAIDADRHG